MNKNEYFLNFYNSIIKNKILHLISTLLEYVFTLLYQIIIFKREFNSNLAINYSSKYFYLIIEKVLTYLTNLTKFIIILIFYVFIVIYYFIFSKFSFKRNNIINKICINIFEIFIFRFFFIFISHILFSINNNISIIFCIILTIPILAIIINSFLLNHLYFFSLHFIIFPYDYFSSFLDVFHLIEKILICISSNSSMIILNKFLFILVFILQIISFFICVYILNYKSYYIMNNIFLNKARFSFLVSTALVNLIMILLGKINLKGYSFLLIVINVYIIFLIVIQVFYNPYNYFVFNTDEHIENLYYYFYIIDQNKNETFLLEEKLENHFSICKNCNLCYNLKKYLMKEVNYKKIYKILYKDQNILEKLVNELIHSLLINRNQSLKNSYYLINIIYCYYIYFHKKDYVLCSNLKILYEKVNEENKHIMENHLLSIEQIILINEFLEKSENILNEIRNIVLEKNHIKRIEYFFDLFKIIFDLKDKKFKKKLYYNKNEGVINFFRYISICTMIYEEIFNITLSNSGISLRENQIFLDDLSNKSNNELNQIIIQFDLLTFETKIIYAIGEFSKNRNKALCQLFPNIFKNKQMMMIKNKLLNLKSFKNEINIDDPFFQNNNDEEGQFINIHCIICDNQDNKKGFKLISLKLCLIYPLGITKTILLAGIYSIEKNIIITLDKSSKEKKKEFILNFDEKENQNENSNNVLIKYKKDNKYFKNQKLIFINRYFINPNYYNIYYILNPIKQKSHKDDLNLSNRNSMKNLFLDLSTKIKNDKYGESEGNQNFNLLIQSTSASASGSTFAQINDNNNFKKRNKNGKKEKKKNNNFKYIQAFLIFFSFFIIIFQIIFHKIIDKRNHYINSQNDILLVFKNYYGIYNTLFVSLISSASIINDVSGKNSSSIVDIYNNILKGEIPGQRLPPLKSSILVNQNIGTSNQMSKVKYKLINALSSYGYKDIDYIINSKIKSYYVSQIISKENIHLVLQSQNNSFLDVLEHMTTSFLVMSNEKISPEDNLYIIDKINEKENNNPFSHISLKRELSQFQINYYYVILNYKTFIHQLDIISDKLIMKSDTLLLSLINYAYISTIINALLYLLLSFSIFLYIIKYFKVFIDLLNDIDNKMNLKNDNISVREMFLQKIEKIKIIVSLYKQNIYQAIVDVNFIYDNYKKFIEEKNKEMAKYLKKEKYLNDLKQDIKLFKSKDKILKIKHLMNIGENRSYITCIIIISIFYIILNIIIFFLWRDYNFVYQRIRSLIQFHGTLSNDGYKIMNYYILMILSNYTIEDINEFEEYDLSKNENIFTKLYGDIEDLYESKKLISRVSTYSMDNIDSYFNYDCQTFYDYLFKEHPFLQHLPANFEPIYVYICQSSNVFQSNNYKHIFSVLFNYIQVGINEINEGSYRNLIEIMRKGHFPKIVAYDLFIYNYIFETLGSQVQRQSYDQIKLILNQNIKIGYMISYIISIIFMLIVIFGYIMNISKNYNKIHELKKVFKVCNKKE